MYVLVAYVSAMECSNITLRCLIRLKLTVLGNESSSGNEKM